MAPSGIARSWRAIGRIDFRQNLVPDFHVSQFRRPALDLGTVDAVTGHAQYSRNVSQMSITTPFGKIPEFAEDHVFWGCDVGVKDLLALSQFVAPGSGPVRYPRLW
jgi:hypothetical protein